MKKQHAHQKLTPTSKINPGGRGQMRADSEKKFTIFYKITNDIEIQFTAKAPWSWGLIHALY